MLYTTCVVFRYKVARLVTVGLNAVHLAEQLWLELIHALKERRYSSAVRHLRDAKRHIAEALRRWAAAHVWQQ